MPKAQRGVLVQCDESIMAIILKIDAQNNHSFILETFDDETCLVSTTKLDELKAKLKEFLKETVKEAEESGSD